MPILNASQRQAIKELLQTDIITAEDLIAKKRKLAKKYHIPILLNSDILKTEEYCPAPLRKILRKRAIRTMSGIAPVAVLTMPYPCPGHCAYCPTEKDVPQSYLSNEPAVMRAIRCGYDPFGQVQLRLKALEANGHQPEKIELIVIGGTWSVLPKLYKYWYISQCFLAANNYKTKGKKLEARKENYNQKLKIENLKSGLKKAQKQNETAKYRIIGVTLETRPDYINDKELLQMRELGCTRVELGVQAIDDNILNLNRRGHGVAEIAQATRLLKNYGFKVTYHIMPALPGSNPKKDFSMFKKLFADQRFQPDQIKFYPTVVTRGSELYQWWQNGSYKPYADKTLYNLTVACKKIVPPYVRIIRLIRDIPGGSIVAGNIITNLRQIMKDRGVQCRCIRCREAKEQKLELRSIKLNIIDYPASGGKEYFISYENKDGKTLYGFCRLRLASTKLELKSRHSEFSSSTKRPSAVFALVRELHVYGELVPAGNKRIIQHAGLGKKLMVQAESLARQKNYQKIAVISGIGARNYYRKLGYKLKNTYLVKNLL